jgi:sucrose phosphorylase
MPMIPTRFETDRRSTPQARIRERLAYLYGADRADELLSRILRIAETHKQLRAGSVEAPFWQHDDLVLITYGDSIQSATHNPLQTLHGFLRQHLADQFSMVHILPFFPYSSDDGFSVTDFRAVNPELGSWDDVAALGRDFDLAIDLVLNHCSRENLWFIDFIAGQEPACGYFIEMDPATNLALVTRPRTTPLLSGVRTYRGLRHVWTTFSNDQVDLNYANPDVLLEFVDLLLYYFRRGARMVRLDAVAYLWKQLGTPCIHLAQTHEIVKLFREVLEMLEPGGLIMTETNVPHAENVTYFGAGDEAQVVYQFSLPPLILHALYSGNSTYLRSWAESLETQPAPPGCTYLNFTASHDGVGLRPLEGLVPKPEVEDLLEGMRARGGYISSKRNSDGSDSPYELNISYFDAFRPTDPRDSRWHIPAFLVSQAMSLSFQGIPAVYIHCLTATPNDNLGVERTGMTRSINRRKWDLSELEALIDDSASETAQVFDAYRRLLATRRAQPAFHPEAPQHVLNLGTAVFGLMREAFDGGQRILALFNLSPHHQPLPDDQLPPDLQRWRELIGWSSAEFRPEGLCLPPYAACWFTDQ